VRESKRLVRQRRADSGRLMRDATSPSFSLHAPCAPPGVRESKRLFRRRLADSNPHVMRKGERS
jgi:hypothetical protein